MAVRLYLLGRADDACVERTKELLEKKGISYDYFPDGEFCLLTPGMRHTNLNTIEFLLGG
jgi:hypothetical protein